MRNVVISALGTALPGSSLPTESFIEHAKTFSCQTPRQERVLEELYRRTAIEQRCSVLTASGDYGKRAERVFAPAESELDRGPSTGLRMEFYAAEIAPLAQRACEAAFAASGTAKESITHIVTVSCTGFYAPGFDIELVQSLPLNPSTKRTHIGFMGCHGGMNGLRVAQAYVQADPSARVLLCAAEACSLHFQYGWGQDRLVANSLFADGAAAAIITSGEGVKIIDTASFIVPDSKEEMLWRIGDNGFEMHLSTAVPFLIQEWLPRFLSGWLSKHDLSIETVASWAVHPGGPKILDAVQTSLSLPSEALSPSREILATCGNMSSPTVFFIMQKLKTHGPTGPCVILGFGPGLTVEAALVHL